ncbi:MAG: FxLYD domain-containing protein [Acidimicrobiales bacterium]
MLILGIGGCSVLVLRAAGDQAQVIIDQLSLDFSRGEVTSDPASCAVIGIQNDGSGDYDVTATVTNQSGVTSAYEVNYELFGPDGESLGRDFGIINRVEPGETVTENTINILDAAPAFEDVTCQVYLTRRITVT